MELFSLFCVSYLNLKISNNGKSDLKKTSVKETQNTAIQRMNQRKESLNTIKIRTLSSLGHVMRNTDISVGPKYL